MIQGKKSTFCVFNVWLLSHCFFKNIPSISSVGHAILFSINDRLLLFQINALKNSQLLVSMNNILWPMWKNGSVLMWIFIIIEKGAKKLFVMHNFFNFKIILTVIKHVLIPNLMIEKVVLDSPQLCLIQIYIYPLWSSSSRQRARHDLLEGNQCNVWQIYAPTHALLSSLSLFPSLTHEHTQTQISSQGWW